AGQSREVYNRELLIWASSAARKLWPGAEWSPGAVALKDCTDSYPDMVARNSADDLPRHSDPFLTIGDTFERKRRRLRSGSAGRQTATGSASTGCGDDGLSSSRAGAAPTAGGPERRRRRR